MKSLTNALISVVIFVLGVFIFTVMLTRGFSPREAEEVLYIQGMLHHGFSLFPMLYGGVVTNFNFPGPLSLSYLSCLLFGKLTLFTVVFPGAIAAALALSFTYLTGALRSRAWGIYAVLFMVGTEVFFVSARALDPYVYRMLITIVSLFFVIVFESNTLVLTIILFILFFLGFFVNGVLGLVFPALLVWIYLLYRQEMKKCGWMFCVAIAAFLIGLGLTIWLASAQGGSVLVHKIITRQINTLGQPQSVKSMYSFLSLLWMYCISFPIALLVIVIRWNNLIFAKNKWTMQFLRTLFSFVIIVVIVTLSNSNVFTSMLMIVPILSLVAGYLFIEEHTGAITHATQQFVIWVISLIPFISLILMVMAAMMNYWNPEKYATAFYMPSIILLILLCLITFFFVFKKMMMVNTRTMTILFLDLLSYLVFNIGLIEQVQANHSSAGTLSRELFSQLQKKPQEIVFYQMGPGKEDLMLMLNLGLSEDAMRLSAPKNFSNVEKIVESPVFIDKVKDLLNYPQPAYVVMKQEVYDQLAQGIGGNLQKILTGESDEEKIVVLTIGH
jgi:hypothetical protein